MQKTPINPDFYRQGAAKVNRRWVQHMMYGANGGVCLIGSLTYNTGRSLSVARRKELHATLRWYPAYWALRPFWVLSISPKPYPTGPMEAWNDMPWRKKSSVIKVLEMTAKHVEKEWFQDQESKLRIKVANLEGEIKQLRRKVARLEAQNRNLWHRVMARHDVEVDKEALAKLDAEMSDAMKKLELL